MKLNILGFSPEYTGNHKYYNVNSTSVFKNRNNNIFFTIRKVNNINGLGVKITEETDEIDNISSYMSDIDFNNYKVKKFFFKTNKDKNFFILDRSNYLYPVELKTNYHPAICKALAEYGHGVFIVTERKIGNPDYTELWYKNYIDYEVQNVMTGFCFNKKTVDSHYTRVYNKTDEYDFKQKLKSNARLRSWRTVIEYYLSHKELLTYDNTADERLNNKLQNIDSEVISKVHSLNTTKIQGNGYLENVSEVEASSVVNFSKPFEHSLSTDTVENTISFLEVQYIPEAELKSSYYITEQDLYIVPEDDYKRTVHHPFSEEAKDRVLYNNRKNADESGIGIYIYHYQKAYNNINHYVKLLNKTMKVKLLEKDLNGKTNYIKIVEIRNGELNTDVYEYNKENLKLLGIFETEEELKYSDNYKEKLELEKIKLETDMLGYRKQELSFRYKELEFKYKDLSFKFQNLNNTQKENVLNLFYKVVTHKKEFELKLKQIEHENEKLVYDRIKRDREILILRTKEEMEEIKLKKEKLSQTASGMSSFIKILDTAHYILSNYIFAG